MREGGRKVSWVLDLGAGLKIEFSLSWCCGEGGGVLATSMPDERRSGSGRRRRSGGAQTEGRVRNRRRACRTRALA